MWVWEDAYRSASSGSRFPVQRFAGNIVAGCSNDSRAWSMNADNRIEGFVGEIDEVRIFGETLTPEQIQFLANKGGTVSRPSPAMGEVLHRAPRELAWAPMLAAKGFYVYLGDNYLAVDEADLSSREYLGPAREPRHRMPSLDEGTWYWRIDTTDGMAKLRSAVWEFRVGRALEEGSRE